MGLFDRLATTLAGDEELPDEPRAEVERAFAEGSAGDWGAAERRLRAAAGAHKGFPALFVALGVAAANADHDEAAIEAFGRAVDLSPHAVDGWLGLGEALVRLRRYDPAREALRKVLARTIDPGRRARAHAGRGRIALALGEPARAVRELREAADLAPLDPEIAHDLGRALQQAGDPEAAAWLARAAHAPDPDPAWILAAAQAAPARPIARALLNAGLDVILPVNGPARATLEAALSRLMLDDGQLDEAAALAEAARAHAPASFVGDAALAAVREAQGQSAAALALAEQALGKGAPVDVPRLLALALAAADRAACLRIADAAAAAVSGDAARGGTAPGTTLDAGAGVDVAVSRALIAAARAFAGGSATDEELVTLGLVAPTEAARAFVAQAASPGPLPDGAGVYGLLTHAHQLALSTPVLAPLRPVVARAVAAFDRPLLIAVMGEFNAGKSSFVNALCGEAVAEVGVTPTTATINVLRYGARGGRVLYHDGRAEDLSVTALAAFFAGLSPAQAGAVRAVEIFRPLEWLSRVEIVDTPGLNSLRPEHEAVARGFLADADAIVWLFAVGQAGKASEREALMLARAAQKRVLGVLNKADQASDDEIAAIERHISSSLGDLVEAVVPFSARRALAAQKGGTDDDGGRAAAVATLEERFFAHARALKASSALASLQRFVAQALALAATPVDGLGTGGADSDASASGDAVADLAAREETVKGAIAAARIATRARLESGFRQAAAELADAFEPRPVRLVGERGAGPAEDRRFAIELLEDAVFEATSVAARELTAVASGGPPLPITRFVERFAAYARGVFRGGRVEQIVGPDGPGAGGLVKRPDAAKIARALIAAMPDLDGELFAPLSAEVTAAFARARAATDEAQRRAELRRLIRMARVDEPMAALAAAIVVARA